MTAFFENLLAPILFFALIGGGIGLYLFCVFDIQKRPVRYLSQKSLWLNIVWCMPLLGALLYLTQRGRYWSRLDGGIDPVISGRRQSSGSR
ncbi:MAG: hypothetical protein EOO11_17710 [Chitinophagaceae bacterium]|nr:MAG: hypothetical protein EOO11_17710 [Chitinophagaceae bacterium]